jgi:hypothetical protein
VALSPAGHDALRIAGIGLQLPPRAVSILLDGIGGDLAIRPLHVGRLPPVRQHLPLVLDKTAEKAELR